MTAGTAARRRSRPGEHPRAPHRISMCEAVLLNTKVVVDEGSRGRASAVTFEGQLPEADAEGAAPSSACSSRRAPAELERAWPGQDARRGQPARASSKSTGRAAPPSHQFSRSATWSANRCSRTRRRTKRASPWRRSLGERVAFEPLAIPAVVFTDPEIAWCGLTETEAAKQKREVAVARFPWGASAVRSRWIARTA